MDGVGRIVDARDFKSRGLKLYPVGLEPDLVSSVRPALLVLAFAGLFLVLVLMVNLGSVLLSRAARREHEFAVSRALGANSVAVARATLFEGGLLGLVGGIAATLAAIGGTRTLIALAPLDLPRRESVAVDVRIGAVIVGLGILLGLLAAILPAIWASRVTLSSLLASSAVRGGGGHGRMRRGMVVAQVALSLVLLSTGGLVVRRARTRQSFSVTISGAIGTAQIPRSSAAFSLSMRSRIRSWASRARTCIAPLDGIALAAAPLVLMAIATVACASPAFHAASTDPAVALRVE